MKNSDMRLRLERLLSGDFRPDDLMTLFLSVRDHPYGRTSIKEVGDFIAHPGQRQKGLVTEAARDFFAVSRMSSHLLHDKIHPLCFKSVCIRSLQATCRLIDAATVKRLTGLKLKVSHRMIDPIVAKIDRVKPRHGAPAEITFKTRLTDDEYSLLNVLCTHHIVKPAFSHEILVRDFLYILKQEKLLRDSEEASFLQISPAISIFAMTFMHQCSIELEVNSYSYLEMFNYDDNSKLGVSARWGYKRDEGEIGIVYTIFETPLEKNEWCTKELLAEKTWNFPLEINRDKRLTSIRAF